MLFNSSTSLAFSFIQQHILQCKGNISTEWCIKILFKDFGIHKKLNCFHRNAWYIFVSARIRHQPCRIWHLTTNGTAFFVFLQHSQLIWLDTHNPTVCCNFIDLYLWIGDLSNWCFNFFDWKSHYIHRQLFIKGKNTSSGL